MPREAIGRCITGSKQRWGKVLEATFSAINKEGRAEDERLLLKVNQDPE